MSRGHGKAQRFVLEALERRDGGNLAGWHWRTAEDLATERAGREPSTAEVESIRRAIRSLGAEGLVEARHFDGHREGEPVTSLHPAMDDEGEFTGEFEEYTHRPNRGFRVLCARLTLTEEERAAEAIEHKEQLARVFGGETNAR